MTTEQGTFLEDTSSEGTFLGRGRRSGVTRRKFAIGAAGALAAGMAGPRAAFAREPVEIGAVAALTGYLAGYDAHFIGGLKLAVSRINAAGGADGHRINLRILDGASNATTGATATNQLLNQYGVAATLNGASSATSMAIQPLLAEAKVPMIILSQLPPDPKWAFLSTTAFSRVMELELQFATKFLKVKRIGILYNMTPAAQSATRLVSELAPQRGLTVGLTQGVETTATDFTPQLAAFKDANVEAILDFMTGPAHILEAKAAATVGLKAPLVMGLDDTPTFVQASVAYPDCYLSAIPVQVYPDIADDPMKSAAGSFLDEYRRAGLDPAGVQAAASGWDAALMLTAAIKKAASIDGDAIRNALETLDYQGAVTHWRFRPGDHTGQAKSEALQMARLENRAMKAVFRSEA
jgi:branched-chain amino acid transport system substrate-binding protein